MEISRATEIDLDGIVELQAANQPERGGTLSASLPRSRIAEMMRVMPLIVARRGGRITGFLMTSTREMNADVPIIRAMLAAYQGATDAYVYGPICVSAEERGKSLAQAMFAELQRLCQDVRAFFLSDVITRHHCTRTQKWECTKWLALCSTNMTTLFCRTSVAKVAPNKPLQPTSGGPDAFRRSA